MHLITNIVITLNASYEKVVYESSRVNCLQHAISKNTNQCRTLKNNSALEVANFIINTCFQLITQGNPPYNMFTYPEVT